VIGHKLILLTSIFEIVFKNLKLKKIKYYNLQYITNFIKLFKVLTEFLREHSLAFFKHKTPTNT